MSKKNPNKIKTDPQLINKLKNANYGGNPPNPIIGRQIIIHGKGDGIYHTIEFHFKDSVDAHNFKLPSMIKDEFFLNEKMMRKSYNKNSVLSYYRLAQIK